MTLFALSDNGLAAILAGIAAFNALVVAVTGILTVVIKEAYDNRRAKAAALLVAKVAEKVEVVAAEASAHNVVQGQKLDKLHDATNGLVEVLGAAREEKGRREGIAEAKQEGKP